MSVFVLDRKGQALMPCTEKRARLLLERGRARVHRVLPMIIRLTDRLTADSTLQPIRIKLDPGSKTSGIALVREADNGIAALNLFELIHRGKQISEALTARRSMRRHRRNQLRCRAPRFFNRGNKGKGWLAPSLQHRVDTTLAWVKRLQRYAPVTGISQELVRFDTQALQNPEISGVEYQQGTLFGYEVKEYLLEKWNRQCAYCDANKVPLEIDHIHAKANGGSDRVGNLTLTCHTCNQRKGALDVKVFLASKPERLAKVLATAKRPLKDAAAVNSTRWKLYQSLKATGLDVEVSTGGKTKFNRTRFDIPKSHALDAVCVGDIESVKNWIKPVLMVKCTGRGSYKRTRLDQFGFPRGYLMRGKSAHGFQTGDMVKAVVPKGKKAGSYTGRVAIRASGSFNIQTNKGLVQGVSHRHCRLIQRNDGYGYQPVVTRKEVVI